MGMRICVIAIVGLLGCKKADEPARTKAVDARQAAPVDAAPAQAPLDAGAAVAIDAAPAIAIDAGAKKPKPKPVDAAPERAVDAAPAPAAIDAGADGPKPCHRTTFDTKLVEAACAKGGQGAAKAAMKKFLKEAKKTEADLECKSCHTKLAPEYPLKDDALEHFQKLGGE